MRITLHNHKFIDSEDKPLISNLQFKELSDKVRSIDNFDISEYKEKYSFIPAQERILTYVFNQRNNTNHSSIFSL